MTRLIKAITELMKKQSPVVIAIDGPCGSGKTTLAHSLRKIFSDSAVVHVDDFFLRPHQRTARRLSEPGGNMDRERLADQVLSKLRNHQDISYKRFDCQSGQMDAMILPPSALYIVEGSYSHHPDLAQYYDLRIFVDVDTDTQLQRLQQRVSPDMLKNFIDTWIPLEQVYFEAFPIKRSSDFIIQS